MNILIVGVGGQGTLLASRILGNLALIMGKDCKLSEVHGMAQRGGSVVTHVKIADIVFSPIITEGEADIIIGFEKLEALRWKHYIKKGGAIVVNEQEIKPMPVIVGAVAYPANIMNTIAQDGRLIEVNAMELANEVGNSKTVNVIMLGVLAKILEIPYADIEKALEMAVPARFVEINKKALIKGYSL